MLLGVLPTRRNQSGVDDEAVADMNAMETIVAAGVETLVHSGRTAQHIIW
jgi:hypothetical protein